VEWGVRLEGILGELCKLYKMLHTTRGLDICKRGLVAMKTLYIKRSAALTASHVFISPYFISCLDNGFDHFVEAH
jgi:hypothetical protein